MRFYTLAIAATLSFTNITPSYAYQAGDWLVRGRIIDVHPNDDSGTLYTAVGALGEGVSVNNDVVPELDITYMLSPHWGGINFSVFTT